MNLSKKTPLRLRQRGLAPLAAVLLLLAGGRAGADFDSGFAAYLSGDYKTAFQDWLPLAEQGHADAQFGMGMLYERGEGVPPDPSAAAKWYLKAAEQDHALAQTALASMYERGRGVPQSAHEAAKWYRRAAELGNPQAQFDLGAAYEYGSGVPADLEQAMAWYQAAAKQGYSRALAKLSELKDRGATPPETADTDFGFVGQSEAGASAPAAEELGPPPDAGASSPSATAGEADGIRLSSYFDRDSALLGWDALKKENPDLLGELSPTVVEAGPDASGAVFYRLLAGPLPDAAAAAALCAKLESRGVRCSPARL